MNMSNETSRALLPVRPAPRFFCHQQPSSHTVMQHRPDHANHRPITIRVRKKQSQPRQLPDQPPFLTLTLKSHNRHRTLREKKKKTDKEHMAQGKLKGLQTSKQKATRQASSSSTTKKGKRYIAPKKADAIKIASLKRVWIRTFSLSPSSISFSYFLGGKEICRGWF